MKLLERSLTDVNTKRICKFKKREHDLCKLCKPPSKDRFNHNEKFRKKSRNTLSNDGEHLET